jgi:hypothetical protein
MRLRPIALTASLGCVLLLAGCGGTPKPAANSLDAMDEALVNGAASGDKAAIANKIRADPAKIARPAIASLAEVAAAQAVHKAGVVQGEAPVPGVDAMADGDCAGILGLVYSKDWATKLPADLPMMPGATLTEAAGRDDPCVLRVVSFSAPGDRSAVLAWYVAKARAAGYSVDHAEKDGDLVLAGDKGSATYYILIGTTSDGHTEIDYVWTHG